MAHTVPKFTKKNVWKKPKFAGFFFKSNLIVNWSVHTYDPTRPRKDATLMCRTGEVTMETWRVHVMWDEIIYGFYEPTYTQTIDQTITRLSSFEMFWLLKFVRRISK